MKKYEKINDEINKIEEIIGMRRIEISSLKMKLVFLASSPLNKFEAEMNPMCGTTRCHGKLDSQENMDKFMDWLRDMYSEVEYEKNRQN